MAKPWEREKAEPELVVGNGTRAQGAVTYRGKALRIADIAIPSRGLWEMRSRRSRSFVSACESIVAGTEARQECQRLGRSDSPFGEENAPGAEKVAGPAEANLGVVNRRIPRQRIWAASPHHESGTDEAWVLVVSVTRGRSRSDASCIAGTGVAQGNLGTSQLQAT